MTPFFDYAPSPLSLFPPPFLLIPPPPIQCKMLLEWFPSPL